MVYAGEPFAHELDFSTGLPLGAVVYSVLGNDNTPITGLENVSVTPDVGAISHLIVVPESVNTVATDLFEKRTLTWSYTTDTGVVNGRHTYRVEIVIPFAVTHEGVREKLGILSHEVEDSRIDLLKAYAVFADTVSEGDLASFENTGGLNALKIIDAIEATAALYLIDSLQLALARSEESGANTYSRYGTIDWDEIRAGLEKIVLEGTNVVDPPVNDIEGVEIFFAVTRSDPFTGDGA